jgi:stage V sporulation protein G
VGRAKLHVDIAHPINSSCRDMIQRKVLSAFREEMDRSKHPDYHPVSDFSGDYNDISSSDDEQETVTTENEEPVEEKRDDNFGKGLF